MARLGPRPISLHLASTLAALNGCYAAAPMALQGTLPWHPELAAEANAWRRAARTARSAELLHCLGNQIGARLEDFIRGLEVYRSHPYRRALPEAPAIWQSGTTRLLDYGIAPTARPVLFVPSLVNRYYVLDLMEGRSLLRWLAARQVRPLVIDWGAPGAEECEFDLSDYVSRRLGPALDAAAEIAGGPVPVVGYCMGGNLALALSLVAPRQVSALALLATPWDFHAERQPAADLMAGQADGWRRLLDGRGELPVDLLQALFAMLDPALAVRKFAAFAALDPMSPAADRFVALEDWLNDGTALTGPAARECLIDWYGTNAPGQGRWTVAGTSVDPAALQQPAFVALPARDRIVPPGSARALVAALPDALVVRPDSGHIGMVVGGKAAADLWQPLLAWLHRR